MFKLQDDFKSEDGYHVVECHSPDEEFAKILLEAMKLKGYDVYGFSDRGGSKQYAFVTAEFAEVLKERHHASCRNSAGGFDPQVIGRAFRKSSGEEVELVVMHAFDADHRPDSILLPPRIDDQAYNDTLIALDTPNQQVLGRMLPLTPDVKEQLDRMKALDREPVDLQERGVGSRIMESQTSGIEPTRTIGYLEPGLGARCFGSGNLDD